MERIAAIVLFMVLGIAAWGCFSLLFGIAKPPRGPFVIGWKARILGLLAIMAIPVSWTLAYLVILVSQLLGANPTGELVVVIADVGAVIAVCAAMDYVARLWQQRDRAALTAPHERPVHDGVRGRHCCPETASDARFNRPSPP